MPKTQPQKIEDWEKELKELRATDLNDDPLSDNQEEIILDFITKLLKSEKEKLLERILRIMMKADFNAVINQIEKLKEEIKKEL